MVTIQAKPAAAPTPAQTSTPAPAANAVVCPEKQMKRKDFATFPEFCEYKKQQALGRVTKYQEEAAAWEKRKTGGEHGDKQVKKLKRIEKMRQALAALEAELAAAGK